MQSFYGRRVGQMSLAKEKNESLPAWSLSLDRKASSVMQITSSASEGQRLT